MNHAASIGGRGRVSLKLLLDDLGHFDVDDENLIEEHVDDLALVLLVGLADLGELLLNVVLRVNQLLILMLSLYKQSKAQAECQLVKDHHSQSVDL